MGWCPLPLNRGVKGSYKPTRAPVKDNATRLGELEYSILSTILESGLVYFALHDVWKRINADRRRVHDALKRLCNRNIVERVGRGFYRLLVPPERLGELLSTAVINSPPSKNGLRPRDGLIKAPSSRAVKDIPRTREPRGVGCAVGVFLDNVRGWTWWGSYVHGDRGALREWGDLSAFESVSYAELSIATGTSRLSGRGAVVLYYDCKEVRSGVVCASDRVEWRPPKGFVKKYGVPYALRVLREEVLPSAFGVLSRALLVANSPLSRVRAELYRLAREVYFALAGRQLPPALPGWG
jgi:hypothetical protein